MEMPSSSTTMVPIEPPRAVGAVIPILREDISGQVSSASVMLPNQSCIIPTESYPAEFESMHQAYSTAPGSLSEGRPDQELGGQPVQEVSDMTMGDIEPGMRDVVSTSTLCSFQTVWKPLSTLSFLGLPIEVRYLVYDELFPNGHSGREIHLTYHPNLFIPLGKFSACFILPREIYSLFTTCCQIYEELASIVYSKNTFVLRPNKPNYNAWTLRDRFSSSKVWMRYMRLETRKKVKKLRVYVDLRISMDAQDVANGLQGYPNMEIVVLPLKDIAPEHHASRCASLGNMVAMIQDVRAGLPRTVWNAGGDSEVASILENLLPSDAEIV